MRCQFVRRWELGIGKNWQLGMGVGGLSFEMVEPILDQLQDDTRKYYDEFWRCQQCAKIYWKGSHFQRMQKLIDSILDP